MHHAARHAPHAHTWARRTGIVGAAISVAVMGGSVGEGRGYTPDPVSTIKRMGNLSPSLLRRVGLNMSLYAQDISSRLSGGPETEWFPGGPVGWRTYDIDQAPSLTSRNLTFEEARAYNALVPVSDAPVQPLSPFVLKTGLRDEEARALLCLTQAVYYEAGYESGEGQRAVAQVVLNRMRHPAYPNSVCGVVYQGSQRLTGCQFSFTCDGSLNRSPEANAWGRARDVARQALAGGVYAPVGASTHYHASYVFPYWAVTLVKINQIGAHIFYRMTGPMGAPSAFTARYSGGELALSDAILNGGDARTPDAPSTLAVSLDGDQLASITPIESKPLVLTIAGESKTYLVANEARPVGPGLAASPVAGLMTPMRRIPTPAEIAELNAKMARMEIGRVEGAYVNPTP